MQTIKSETATIRYVATVHDNDASHDVVILAGSLTEAKELMRKDILSSPDWSCDVVIAHIVGESGETATIRVAV